VPNLALIALGDSHHSQGGMKFATQISPLLNLYLGKKGYEGGIKVASNLIVVFYFNRQDIQKIGTSNKIEWSASLDHFMHERVIFILYKTV
jgi:hypothetical protein